MKSRLEKAGINRQSKRETPASRSAKPHTRGLNASIDHSSSSSCRVPTADTDGPWYTVRDVADQFRVSERTVRRWIATGLLDAKRVGRCVRIARRALANMGR